MGEDSIHEAEIDEQSHRADGIASPEHQVYLVPDPLPRDLPAQGDAHPEVRCRHPQRIGHDETEPRRESNRPEHAQRIVEQRRQRRQRGGYDARAKVVQSPPGHVLDDAIVDVVK
jgi:hypothetical protein